MSSSQLQGQVALVTGATAGLGRVTAEELARKGATVVLACRNLEAAEKVAGEIRSSHPKADVVVGPRLDLASHESVRSFAAKYKAQGRPLHILVNNAGTNYIDRFITEDGVGGLAQINYLGPYTLTRLLEGVLVKSAPSRVVNLSSIMHRFASLPNPPASFLHDWSAGGYAATKLANVLFTYEAQRRLGPLGVQSCAVDPGGVSTSIWKGSAFSRPPLSWVIKSLYAPATDGAASTVYAACLPLGGAGVQQPRRVGFQKGSVAEAHPECRYYARGLFASRWVTNGKGQPPASGSTPTGSSTPSGGGGGSAPRRGRLLPELRYTIWAAGTGLLSLLDWPLRRLSGGATSSMGATLQVPSLPASYDKDLAAKLWDMSADLAKVPRQPSPSS